MLTQMKEILLVMRKKEKRREKRITKENARLRIYIDLIDRLGTFIAESEKVLMTQQKRTFFVDDILHKVTPSEETRPSSANEKSQLKRRRSSDHQNEETSAKKYRAHEDYSPVVDVIGDNDSYTSENSQNIDNHSGKCT